MLTPAPTIRLGALAVLVALALSVVPSCSSDDGDSEADASAPAGAEVGTGGGGAGEGKNGSGAPGGSSDSVDLEEGLEAVGLETKGEAIVSAMGAERYEMLDGVLHVHLGDDSRAPRGTECMIAGSVLSDGESVVVHVDGEELEC